MAKMLTLSQSTAAKEFYDMYKCYYEAWTMLLEEYIEKRLGGPNMVEKFESLNLGKWTGAKVVAVMTVTQAAQRPLKVGETRPAVLKKCARMIKSRKMYKALPQPMKLFFTQQYNSHVAEDEREILEDDEATDATPTID